MLQIIPHSLRLLWEGNITANIYIQITCPLAYVYAYVLSEGSCWASASQSMVQSSLFFGLLPILYRTKTSRELYHSQTWKQCWLFSLQEEKKRVNVCGKERVYKTCVKCLGNNLKHRIQSIRKKLHSTLSLKTDTKK